MGPFWVFLTCLRYPLRARARTMICQKCRFIKNGIKTRSSGGIQGPKMRPHFGALKMARTDDVTGYTSISLHPVDVRIFAGIYTSFRGEMGTILGVFGGDHGLMLFLVIFACSEGRNGTSDPAHQMAHFAHNTYPYHCTRAYNDLHQHQGCIKNSIKMGSHLMLV